MQDLSSLSLFCYTSGGKLSSGTGYDASCLLLPSFCSYLFNCYCFLPHGATAPMGQGLLIIKAPQSHSDTPHLVGVLWMSDQPDAETSTWQHNTHNRQTSTPPVGFEPAIPESQQPQSRALDCMVTGIGLLFLTVTYMFSIATGTPVLFRSSFTTLGYEEEWSPPHFVRSAQASFCLPLFKNIKNAKIIQPHRWR